ncbi:MAG: alanine--tRNA ligase [Conexivisphaerales archaeon]
MATKDLLRRKFAEDYSKYYKVALFSEEGFARRQCSNCGKFIWTTTEAMLCPDCQGYSFIGRPPTSVRKDYTTAWAAIEKYFVDRGHTSVKRYPVVARWRPDLYFTVASIIDFQRVENGKIIFDFPANPLIIPQMCLRFNDIENVGVTGRHYTSFCMVGQHAVNNAHGYWKDRTIELDYGLLTGPFGVPKDEITFVEDVWLGYGAFGYSLEYYVRGLEIGNAVFTEFEGSPESYVTMPHPIVDMGAGLNRFSWMTRGTPTSYEAVFGPVYDHIIKRLGLHPDSKLLTRYYSLAGSLDVTEVQNPVAAKEAVAKKLGLTGEGLEAQIAPMEAVFSLLDHSRTLLFAIVDGALPSNVAGGYNLRVLFRRAQNFIEEYGWDITLAELASLHAEFLKPMYPELAEGVASVEEIFDVEERRYDASKARVSSIVQQLQKSKKSPLLEDLIRLYDSEGVTPELLKENGLSITVPSDFYMKVTERHIVQKQAEEKPLYDTSGLPRTRPLFYEERSLFDFDAKVLRAFPGDAIVLDQSAFYPRSGGQEPDLGTIEGVPVVDVIKYGDVIVHVLKGRAPAEGATVHGRVDQVRRGILMRHHTATHIVNGAARQVLGPWVWQHSAYKDIDKARLDITHHSHLTREEMLKIEEAANQVVRENILVDLQVLPRSVAEQKYGFRLYQGGVIPAKELRVQKIGDFDVEACGGTHCQRTGDVGYIKLLKAERLQDGVERLEFAAGGPAVKYMADEESRVLSVAEQLQTQPDQITTVVGSLKDGNDQLKKRYKSISKELSAQMAANLNSISEDIGGIRLLFLDADYYDDQAHITMGEQIVEKRPDAIYVGAAKLNGRCRIIIFAGEKARAAGVDASLLVRGSSTLLKGSGGGTAKMAQGGGEIPVTMQPLRDLITRLIREATKQ